MNFFHIQTVLEYEPLVYTACMYINVCIDRTYYIYLTECWQVFYLNDKKIIYYLNRAWATTASQWSCGYQLMCSHGLWRFYLFYERFVMQGEVRHVVWVLRHYSRYQLFLIWQVFGCNKLEGGDRIPTFAGRLALHGVLLLYQKWDSGKLNGNVT